MRYATLKPLVLWLKRKKILNLFTKQKQTHRQKTLTITRVGRGGKQTRTAVCKIGKQQGSTVEHRNYTQHLVVTHEGKNLKKNVCICIYVCVCVFSCVQLFATPWTVTCQDLLSMEFSRQEYWRGLPFPTPGDLSDPGNEPESLVSPALTGGFLFCQCTTWEALIYIGTTKSLWCTLAHCKWTVLQ